MESHCGYNLHISIADFLIDYFKSDGDSASLYRQLHEEEVLRLIASGNCSSDWRKIRVNLNFSDFSKIRGCSFEGFILIGTFTSTAQPFEGIEMPTGLYNSNFVGFCHLNNDCLIRNVTVVSNAVIGERTSILDCTAVGGTGRKSFFGNGIKVHLGPETGGREVMIWRGIRYETVVKVCLFRENRIVLASAFEEAVEKSSSLAHMISVIGNNCIITNCPQIRDVIISDTAIIRESTINNCTIESNLKYKTVISMCSSMNDCIISAGCLVTGPCSVESTLLFESARIGTSAKIKHCILGPDSFLEGVECLHSLIGPFVGAHHSALVISTFWATGRGNVSYGAKLGANHTGRINDQEFLSGEGCFYGLGVQLKFPFNSLFAPYSLIAG
jgi:hypothetical protein